METTEQITTLMVANRANDKEVSMNTTQAKDITLRAGGAEDAEDCGYICYGAFKAIADEHNFPPDFPSSKVTAGLMASLLSRDDVYSVVAEVDGRVVGSN